MKFIQKDENVSICKFTEDIKVFKQLRFCVLHLLLAIICLGWLGSRVVSVLDSGAEGPGSNRSLNAVG